MNCRKKIVDRLVSAVWKSVESNASQSLGGKHAGMRAVHVMQGTSRLFHAGFQSESMSTGAFRKSPVHRAWILGSFAAAAAAGTLAYSTPTTYWESECKAQEFKADTKPQPISVDGVASFDHVILGGGTAGCVIAYLISKWCQDAGFKANILLVDGGPGYEEANPDMQGWYDNWGEFGRVHDAQYTGHGSSNANHYHITPSDHRGLGGCGAHDTRIFYLPTDDEQKDYAKAFGWSDEEFKTYFQAALNLEPTIKACPHGEEFFDRVIDSLNRNLGVKRLKDNRFWGEIVRDSIAYFDVGAYAVTDTHAIRWTPALLINDAEDGIRPKSLKVLKQAEIDSIKLSEDTKIVHRVDVSVDGKPRYIQLNSGGSVTLSAGAIGNAAVLQRSGVGDPKKLQNVGVKPLIPLPEVGHGVDHEEIAVQYAAPEKWPGDKQPPGGVMGWALGIFRSLEGLDQMMQAHFSIAGPPYDDEITVVGTPNNCKPDLNKGYRVEIQSSDPHESAKLVYEYSSQEREVFLKGVKTMIEMFEALKKDGLVGERVAPEPLKPDGTGIDLNDDDAVWEWVHGNKGTAYHWQGTCKAGISGSVADEKFRLRKGVNQKDVVDNLFLSSAAVLPFPPTANPHVTIQAFAVAEAMCAFEKIAESHGTMAKLPEELEVAKSQIKASKTLEVRSPGEEKPSLGHIAKKYQDSYVAK